jgi:hypothetical protein
VCFAEIEAGGKSASEEPMGNGEGQERAQVFRGEQRVSGLRPSCGTSDLTLRTDGGGAPEIRGDVDQTVSEEYLRRRQADWEDHKRPFESDHTGIQMGVMHLIMY